MSKFKVGDRVVVGEEEPDLMWRGYKTKGQEGVVTNVFVEGGSEGYDVLLDPITWSYVSNELEPA